MTIDPATPSPSRTARPRAGGSLILILGALVAVAGLAFAGGRATAPATTGTAGGPNNRLGPGTSFAPGAGGPGASFAPGASGPGGVFGSGELTVSGTVRSITGETLTLTTSDGQTVEVDLSGATYHSQAAASATDVTTGSEVIVRLSPGAGGPPGAAPSASPGASAPSRSLSAADVTVVTP
jgi:hypothetical protein